MANEMRFDGKVALVTGAGNGLGRSHALLFGARGASVVVNDLGGGPEGSAGSSAAADAVVAEIRKAGGEAVPSYDSVEEGEKIVRLALDRYGRLDILVNNAGILRDISFAKMSEEDWELIMRVHLRGGFKVAHAAWPQMRDQEHGRIVNTASAAGIYGNFGQTNYSSAKLALLGMARTLALEGKKHNILVNAVAPVAASRLTETVLPPDTLAALDPGCVSALVAYLCHESCAETGSLFEVGGGFFAKLRWERAAGRTFRIGRAITPELVRGEWNTITSFDQSTHPTDLASALAPIMANVHAGPSKGGNELIDLDLALGYEFPDTTSSYDERDVAIYALGVGAAQQPDGGDDLPLVYEMHPEGFRVLPTFGVIPGLAVMLEMARSGGSAPGCHYSLDRLLHGEQYTEVKLPLPPKATLTNRSRIVDIFDKGENALMILETRSFDEAGTELIVNRFTAVIRGAGGWGGERGPSEERNIPPEREPDARVEQAIGDNQALLYRLSGDWNPLHADPTIARAFGFERPILHGLCTFGYVARHVIDSFAGGDLRLFKSIQVRFAESVYPGETLVTEMWRESEQRIVLRASVKEREVAVLTQAVVELYREIPRPVPPAEGAPADRDASASEPEPSGPASGDIFHAIARHVADHPEVVDEIQTVYQFVLTEPESTWTVDLKSGAVNAGKTEQAECTLTLSDTEFVAMCSGAADAQQLFFSGKLQIAGNIMASQQLEFLKEIDPETVLAVAEERRAEGGDALSEPGPPAEAVEPRAAEIFAALCARLGDDPGAAAKLDAVCRFEISAPAATWTLSCREGAEVLEGSAVQADTILMLADADLVALATGGETAASLFQKGKLRIEGDLPVAHRLGFLHGLIEPEGGES